MTLYFRMGCYQLGSELTVLFLLLSLPSLLPASSSSPGGICYSPRLVVEEGEPLHTWTKGLSRSQAEYSKWTLPPKFPVQLFAGSVYQVLKSEGLFKGWGPIVVYLVGSIAWRGVSYPYDCRKFSCIGGEDALLE